MKLVCPLGLVLIVAAVLGWSTWRAAPGCGLQDKTRLSFYITFERVDPPQGEPKSAILRLHNNTTCPITLDGASTDGQGNGLKSGIVADGELVPALDRFQGLQISHRLITSHPAPPEPTGTTGPIDRLMRSVVLNGSESLLFDVNFEDLREQRGVVLQPVFLWELAADGRAKYKDYGGTFHAAYFMYGDFPESVQAAIGFDDGR